MASTAGTTYQDYIEGKLIAAIGTSTTTGVTVKIKQVNGATPTWPTAAHRIKIVQKTATNNKVEKFGVASGTSQSGQTVTLGTLTRALSLSDGTNFSGSVGTAQSFSAGADVFITWDSHDAAQTLKADIVNTITGVGAIRGSSTTVPMLRSNSMTTSQRTASSPSNGDEVYDSDLGQKYDYVGGAWTARASGTNPNAANTTAGKVDLATAAEVAAGTATDATSLASNVIPVAIVKTSSTGAVNGTVPALNSAVSLDVTIGGTGRTSVTTGALLIGAGNSAMTVTGPGSSGQVPVSNGTTIAMASAPNYNKVLYTSTSTSASVGASDTNELNVATNYSIATGEWVAGNVIRLTCGGNQTWAAGTMTVRVKLGSVTIWSSGALTPASTGEGWKVDCDITCRTLGSSGTVMGNGSIILGTAGTNFRSAIGTAPTEATVNTTGSLTLQVSVQFGTSNGTNGLDMRSFVVERLATTAA